MSPIKPDEEPAAPVSVTRSGFVALAGRPNVGKSTLVNRMVGEHVAAVSDKPQTTRRRQLGVVSHGDAQLVLVDLPGFQKPFDRLTERMQHSVDESLEGVDAVAMLLDATAPIGGGDRHIAGRLLRPGGIPCLIVLNKVDRLQPAKIGQAIEAAAALAAQTGGDFVALHPVSALTGDGVDALVADLVGLLPGGPAYFPAGVVSDQSIEQRVAELVREVALQLTREEVPHSVAVVVDEIERMRRGLTIVRCSLVCETKSQKTILVGKGGAMVREIGTRARPAVERILDRRVHLELTVRVRRHWRRDEAELDRLGV
jgi:GTP-binding protein Era